MWSDLRPDKQTRDAHTPAIASCYVHNARPFWQRLDGFRGSSSGETWRTVAPIAFIYSQGAVGLEGLVADILPIYLAK